MGLTVFFVFKFEEGENHEIYHSSKPPVSNRAAKERSEV